MKSNTSNEINYEIIISASQPTHHNQLIMMLTITKISRHMIFDAIALATKSKKKKSPRQLWMIIIIYLGK